MQGLVEVLEPLSAHSFRLALDWEVASVGAKKSTVPLRAGLRPD
jgi:hypothetical protein